MRFGLRAAAVVLVALLALCIGVMPLAPAAFGAPVPPGPLGYWFRSGSGGFGVGGADAMAMPMAWYKGVLYAGVSNSSGAQVWYKDGATWKDTGQKGFSSTSDIAVTSMCVFEDYLYVGSANIGGGCSVWRYDGDHWQDALAQGSSPPGLGFGNTNNHAATAMKVFKNELYVGLTNVIISFPTGTNGAQLWKTPDGVNWTEVDDAAFDDAANYGVTALEEYSGSLYACTARFDLQWGTPDFFVHLDIKIYDKGCQLLKSGSGSAGTWSVAATDGFGDPRNIAALAMHSYGGKLYIGTANANAVITVELATLKVTNTSFSSNGLQVYSYDGSGVPAAVVTGGFGYTSDAAVMCMNEVSMGVKDYLMVGTVSTSGPGKLKLFDGTSWSDGAYDGFGFDNNVGVSSLAVDNTGSPPVVWTGTMNSDSGCEVWYTTDKLPPPGIDSITPSVGAQGGTVKITDLGGVNFDTDLGIVRLERGSQAINATGISVSPDGRHATCSFDLSGATTGLWDVYVENPDGQSYKKSGAFTVTLPTWYLAEGTSDWGFDTYVTIENPNPAEVTAKVTYMTGSGAKARPDITLPAMSQTVINPRNDLGAADFSTRVECKEGKNIAVDRRMIWTGPGAPSPEGHSSIGVTSAAPTWYLAEGSSNWGFETWLLIQNPNSKDATCNITYMIEGVGPKTVTKTVKANSRASFNMAEDIGAADASIKVVSTRPVIAERAMYRNNRREGHDSIGTTAPATDYYLAEGTTAWGFTTYVLVQNPNTSAASVTVTYMTPTGAQPQPAITLPANSRKTIRVNDVAGMGSTDLSTRVHGSKPIIAERAMYWGSGTSLGEACHDSIGMSSPHTTFFLPDGETDNGYETWTLVQNPNSSSVKVTVAYLTPAGTGNQSLTATIPGNSRQSFNMADKISSGRASIMVTCTTAGKKIMCERAMYWNNRGAGTDTIGGYSD